MDRAREKRLQDFGYLKNESGQDGIPADCGGILQTFHRLPGTVDIDPAFVPNGGQIRRLNLHDRDVSVLHHAWHGEEWSIRPLFQDPAFFPPRAPERASSSVPDQAGV